MLELKTITLSVKMRILAPAHLSATGIGRVFGLVCFVLAFTQTYTDIYRHKTHKYTNVTSTANNYSGP